MVLHGRVVNLGSEKLSFRLLYSEGLNHIAYKDIDSIVTKYNYHISFKRMDIEGRVIGIEQNNYQFTLWCEFLGYYMLLQKDQE